MWDDQQVAACDNNTRADGGKTGNLEDDWSIINSHCVVGRLDSLASEKDLQLKSQAASEFRTQLKVWRSEGLKVDAVSWTEAAGVSSLSVCFDVSWHRNQKRLLFHYKNASLWEKYSLRILQHIISMTLIIDTLLTERSSISTLYKTSLSQCSVFEGHVT